MKLFVIALLGALTISACGSAPKDSAPTTTVDVAGSRFTVPVKPSRVVTIWQPGLAASVQLGLPVVGTVGDPGSPDHGLGPFLPADYPRGGLSIVSNSAAVDDVNIEKIAALHPDVIIGAATGNKKQSAVSTKLSAIAPLVLLPWKATGSWRDYFNQVAAVFGKTTKAHAAENDYRAAVSHTQSVIGAARHSSVSLTRIQKPGEFRVETPQSFDGQVLTDIGLRRPAGQQQPDPGRDYVSVSAEQLNRADADYLFALPNTNHSQQATQLTGSPLWPTLHAAQSHHAYAVDYLYWSAGNYYAATRILNEVTAAFTDKLPAL